MAPTIDMTGRKYGKVTVIEYLGRVRGKHKWLGRCDCGKEKVFFGSNLREGKTTSCGCVQRKLAADAHRTHNMAGTRLHRIWLSMRRRCLRENDAAYPDYGGRGIKIDKRWDTFENFFADLGEAYNAHVAEFGIKETTIERIDNEGNYEPSNVRWATRAEQKRNRRISRKLTFNGRTMVLADWAREIGMSHGTLHARIKSGWSVEKALTTPLMVNHFKYAKVPEKR